ncbi:LPS export ABC transporter periplasmic protein LptC [Oceanihabitans sediminis]|uniref:LPS export ABC transporter periplasmic protein LptC n=1 Tax=Oceanihabitans sediminis TaxID=1812012 RepID=A0A368PBT6_9FLAO|nr:LPS export ABC transporter periplasmic protein LptC [Oceanihabitans sediminis]MDX1278195.1 LPS export ABC transporter periplasmic protein LptC [Oceanihabitans sediminis]MDX1773938.1 LPS export ABC transporter periplasmic protein LptC [Oceanihabitans sediminis]RBP32036.1 LPS export ABC transporter protein LptC [Oceanihabitans sediminis]RCU58691.1 LPS export ABC transporter periplasmic protein LptC [Oceanihabitans sediminis]
MINKSLYIKSLVTVFTVTLFFSCKSNFDEVQKMGVSEDQPIGVAENINLKYTDSGRVTANLISPKMLDFTNRPFGYNEFPDGITLYMYDEQNQKNTVIADYAISYSETSLIDLQGNVVVTSHKKDTLFAEQLYYDQKKEWLFTNKPVTFRQGRDLINGNGFDSDSKFKQAQVLEIDGIITLNE